MTRVIRVIILFLLVAYIYINIILLSQHDLKEKALLSPTLVETRPYAFNVVADEIISI